MKYHTGPDNLEFMKALLIKEAPIFYDLVKVFYANGLIQGLRGLTIAINEAEQVQPAPTEIATCDQCKYFIHDSLNSQGIGACERRVTRHGLLYPKQNACYRYEAK